MPEVGIGGFGTSFEYSRVLMENDTMSDDLYLPFKNELPSRLESFWFIIIIRPINDMIVMLSIHVVLYLKITPSESVYVIGFILMFKGL